MYTVATLRKHVAWKVADDVKAICQPLFDRFGINYFNYGIVYPDGSGTVLVSDRHWFEHYVTNRFKVNSAAGNSGVHLWSSYMDAAALSDARNYFNHDYGISIFKPGKHYCENLEFAATRDNHKILDFYFNNLDLLHAFVLYFKETARKLITLANHQRFIIPSDMQSESMRNFNEEKKIFLEEIQPKKYYLEADNRPLYLTRREVEVLKHYSSGCSIKEIAKQMHISPRSVETYLTNAKVRLGVHNKVEIIKIMSQL
jgi:DNA-binding CsgD family transcriptional regulator